jgi:hypothetical protein
MPLKKRGPHPQKPFAAEAMGATGRWCLRVPEGLSIGGVLNLTLCPYSLRMPDTEVKR